MQNDPKLPIEKRRNYKHCFDGIYKIYKTEGFWNLYAGFHLATARGIFVTIGNIKIHFFLLNLILKQTHLYLRSVGVL